MTIMQTSPEAISPFEKYKSVPSPLGGYALSGVAMEKVYAHRTDGSSLIQSPVGFPDTIARKSVLFPLSDQDQQLQEQQTDALMDLATNYGIQFPGIASFVPTRIDPRVGESYFSTFTTTQRVNGLNMNYDIDKIPPEITLAVIENIIRYYEDASNDESDKLYLTDIHLVQLMYGTVSGSSATSTPTPILVDIDPYLSNIHMANAWNVPDGAKLDRGPSRLHDDIILFEKTSKQFVDSDLKDRLYYAWNAILEAQEAKQAS
jgi:hypothetical protein